MDKNIDKTIVYFSCNFSTFLLYHIHILRLFVSRPEPFILCILFLGLGILSRSENSKWNRPKNTLPEIKSKTYEYLWNPKFFCEKKTEKTDPL